MKFTLLGSGTSTGVPMPGCVCEVCTSTDPRNQRCRTSAYLHTDAGGILIDASTDLRHQALRWDVRRVDSVLFTHAHADHILGIDDLRVFNFVQKSSIPCYGSGKTLEGIRKMFGYLFDRDPLYEGGALARLELIEIEHSTPFVVQGLEIQPFELLHGRLPVTGYRFGPVAYATDCSAIPAESMEMLRGVKYLFLDGLRYEPHPTHLSIPEAIEIANALEAEQTWLIHTTHNVDYERVSADLPPGIALGYDGLEINFDL
jgi:phosphoribosyl 1,2-cyclic phosphate phosphodiesterase